MLLEVRWETKRPFLVSRKILWFLSIFKKSKASSCFEVLNSVCITRCQKDVIPPVQMRLRPTAISSVSTGDSEIPSFVTRNTSLNLSHCRDIRPSFESGLSRFIPLETENTVSLSPTIAEGKLHLRCLWKTGSPLQSRTGNQLSSWDNMWCIELPASCCTEMNIHIDLRRVSQRISEVSSRKSSHLYCILWNTG